MLTTNPLDEDRRRQQRSLLKRERRRSDAQQEFVNEVNRNFEGVSSGTAVPILDDLSRIFLQVGRHDSEVDGLVALVSETNPDIAAAALAGFDAILRTEVPVSPRELGAREAKGHRLHEELPILAAVMRRMGKPEE